MSIEGLKVFDIDVKRCESKQHTLFFTIFDLLCVLSDFVKTNAAMLVPRLKPTEAGAQTDLGDSIFARLRQVSGVT